MSRAAHSPGPWCLDDGLPGGVYSNDATGSIVARCMGIGFETVARRGEESKANARLISTAPDLLDALKRVVAQIEDYERVNNLAPNPGRKHCWYSVAHAHAVIAQAEGAVTQDKRADG